MDSSGPRGGGRFEGFGAGSGVLAEIREKQGSASNQAHTQ